MDHCASVESLLLPLFPFQCPEIILHMAKKVREKKTRLSYPSGCSRLLTSIKLLIYEGCSWKALSPKHNCQLQMGELLNYELLWDWKRPPQDGAGKAGANTLENNNIIDGFHPKMLDITGKYMPPSNADYLWGKHMALTLQMDLFWVTQLTVYLCFNV